LRRTKVIRVRVDKGLYDFIEREMKRNGFSGVSQTVRFFLRIVQFLTETATLPVEKDVLVNWMNFLREEDIDRRF